MVEPGRFFDGTAGTAERAARISSTLRTLAVLKWDFAIDLSPAVSRAKSWSSAFSLITPLCGGGGKGC